MRVWLGLACLSLAAGCGGDGAGGADAMGNAAAGASAGAGADKGLPRPGKYDVTVVREELGSAEPGQMERLQGLRCVAGGDSGPEEIIKTGTPPDCSTPTLSMEKGRVLLVTTCPMPDASPPATMEGRGTYSPEGWDVTIDFDFQGERYRGTQTARRVGDC